MRLPTACSLVLCGVLSSLRAAEPLIDFPTDNHALAEGHPQDFFMFVERNFEGEKSHPWQGGQFGFVRGPVRSGGRVIYTHLHEGVDIKPMRRDAQGNPLDQVRAAAAGRIVHVSRVPGASNYGRYVVVEHLWDGCPYFTLYAHLASISVETGQTVRRGESLGVMGFSGVGIDRERAHVHFEVGLLLSKNFDAWHNANFPASPNRHGIYNGLNLAGVDPARLLLQARLNPHLKISDYFSSDEPAFSILINDSPNFSLIRTYPWLVPTGEVANPPAWKVTFSRTGLPLKVEASPERISEPRAVWVRETPSTISQMTKGYITGSASAPRLTDSGRRFARLLTWPD
jgi:hypothetical protein